MTFYISTHVGLGDHLLCNGLYRHFASFGKIVYLPCRKTYYHSIRRMLADLSNVKVMPYSDLLVAQMTKSHRDFLEKKGHSIIDLGIFGDNFYEDQNIRYDEKFYSQAGVPFDYRWSKFYYPRNNYFEKKLFESLVGTNSKYVFLHEDKSRGFSINRDLIPREYRIIEPRQFAPYGNFFNYTKVLENATEIHCIESSFAALIESLNINTPKFAHRYARPEARSSFFHEFTYKSEWTIYN